MQVGTRLFVVGGYADSALNDLYVLDTGSATWGQPPISGVPPSPRCYTECVTTAAAELDGLGPGIQ